MGISGGGTIILYTSAIDDRVKVSVLSGSFCTFKDSIFTRSHCIDNYVPGVLKDFETSDIIGLIAPRAVFAENGLTDRFSRGGRPRGLAKGGRDYRTLGAGDRSSRSSSKVGTFSTAFRRSRRFAAGCNLRVRTAQERSRFMLYIGTEDGIYRWFSGTP